jgi:hypothetical protein
VISPGADSASVRSAMRTWSRPINGIAGGGHTNVSAGDRLDVRGPSPARLDCDSTNLGTPARFTNSRRQLPPSGASLGSSNKTCSNGWLMLRSSLGRSLCFILPETVAACFRPLKLSCIHSSHYRAARQTHPPPQRPRHPHYPQMPVKRRTEL